MLRKTEGPFCFPAWACLQLLTAYVCQVVSALQNFLRRALLGCQGAVVRPRWAKRRQARPAFRCVRDLSAEGGEAHRNSPFPIGCAVRQYHPPTGVRGQKHLQVKVRLRSQGRDGGPLVKYTSQCQFNCVSWRDDLKRLSGNLPQRSKRPQRVWLLMQGYRHQSVANCLGKLGVLGVFPTSIERRK